MTERPSTTHVSRRRLVRTGAALVALGGVGTAAAAPSGPPDFEAGILADGERWGTKVTGAFDEPENLDALDPFFVVANSNNPAGQPPVGEAGPGNPAYNGGRWFTHTVEWTDDGFDAHGTVPVLTRYGPAADTSSILYHANRGHLTVDRGSPAGGPPPFFRCPLLPYKG